MLSKEPKKYSALFYFILFFQLESYQGKFHQVRFTWCTPRHSDCLSNFEAMFISFKYFLSNYMQSRLNMLHRNDQDNPIFMKSQLRQVANLSQRTHKSSVPIHSYDIE